MRGAAIRPFITWYIATHGREGIDRAVASIQPGRYRFDPRRSDLGIALTEWYPAPVVHRMLESLLSDADEAERSAIIETGAQHAVETTVDVWLRGMLRLFVSPRLCAFAAPTLWQAFYNTGQVTIDTAGRRSHVMTVSDWDGHHEILCRMNNASGRWIYRAVGCRDAATEHTACVSRGDRRCVYLIRW